MKKNLMSTALRSFQSAASNFSNPRYKSQLCLKLSFRLPMERKKYWVEVAVNIQTVREH